MDSRASFTRSSVFKRGSFHNVGLSNLGYFFKNFGKFTPSEQVDYVKAYTGLTQVHAAFEIYRAFPANTQFNAAQREPNNAPLFLGAGENILECGTLSGTYLNIDEYAIDCGLCRLGTGLGSVRQRSPSYSCALEFLRRPGRHLY
jgi:hypothetical protein